MFGLNDVIMAMDSAPSCPKLQVESWDKRDLRSWKSSCDPQVN